MEKNEKKEQAELRAVSIDKQVVLLGSGDDWEGWYPVEPIVVPYLENLKKFALHSQVEYTLTEGTQLKKPHISFIKKIGQTQDKPFQKAGEFKPYGKSDEVQAQIRRNGALNTALKFLELNHKEDAKVTLIELYKTAEQIEGYILSGTSKINDIDNEPIPEVEM